MVSKIRVRLGDIEIDYEGSEEFIKSDLAQLLKSISDFCKDAPSAGFRAKGVEKGGDNGANGNSAIIKNPTALIEVSISTIAARLEVKQGPELVIAALAHSELVEARPKTTRSEIIDEMKKATGFFKQNYVSNLSASLASLVKTGSINEISAGTYTLSNSNKQSILAKLSIET